ncbi:hypothetical protein Tco_0765459, partial [Tanacetum coccineum]
MDLEEEEEDPKIDLDEEEEDPEMDVDDKEEEEPLPASLPPLSPLRTPPPVSESSSDSDIPLTTNTTIGRPFKGPLSTYEVGEPSSIASALVFSARYELNQLRHDFGILGSRVQSLTRGMGTHRTKIAEAHKEAIRARRRLDRFIWEMSFVVERDIPKLMNGLTATGDRLTLSSKIKSKTERRFREIRLEVASVDWYRLECELCSVRAQMHAIQQELCWRGFEENHPTESIDVLATYGDADPPELQEPSDTQ